MTASRARLDRRQAILEGAFTVFARQGYAQSCMQDIADEAGVAKPTMYNYFSDKATLFQEALQVVARSTLNDRLAVLEPLVDPGEDLRAVLESTGHELVRLHCDDRSWALRRLLLSEITRLPGLLDIIRETGTQRLQQALAGALARLMVAGRLRSTDPGQAAEQFIALLTGPLEARCLMATRRIDDTEVQDMVRAAVRTFLRAMAPILTAADSKPRKRT
ncbi:TetR/AcrR family transcriptional regulator [Streptomyces chartreusis]|uniref:TetR/AcrR family transcriptional regulator n=1 Tax=Streptomyces chartreusis TaxID=1969 RepID=UPI002F906771|nr:TetR/AcrR family transcriptional regulator [Streptomyces chartreusis]WTA33673.1 TetR/AcrR family transcriptional regulator [Streptomyces chartreusis]